MCSWDLDVALSGAGWPAWPPLPLPDWGEAREGEQKPLFSCGCQGAEGLIPGTGWDPLTLPGRKLEPILPYLPALTSFEDGTEEPWEGVHLPCDSHINH